MKFHARLASQMVMQMPSWLPLTKMPDSVPLTGETIVDGTFGTQVHSGHIKDWTKRDPQSQHLNPGRMADDKWQWRAESLLQQKDRIKRRGWLCTRGWGWGGGAYRFKVLKELHETHPGTSCVDALTWSQVWWSGIDQDIVKEMKCSNKCQLHQSVPAEAPL